MELTIVYFWFAFSIIVGVAAHTRGRNELLWFLMAAVFTPLVAGCLLLAMEIKPGHVYVTAPTVDETPRKRREEIAARLGMS